MQTPTYRITTLGCRVNHAESREMAAVLESRGLCQADRGDSADLEVVHSCTVTQTASAKSRNAIRRAARRQADRARPWKARQPFVMVTGCYASSHPDEAAEAAGPGTPVVPQSEAGTSTMLERFQREVDEWLSAGDGRRNQCSTSSIRTPEGECSPHGGAGAATEVGVLPLPVVQTLPRRSRHVRAELRVQDGCDAHCTFCIIPRIRRTLRSKRPAAAAAEARLLVERGHREIVLTGIFLGAYGHETALRRRQRNRHASPLADLIDTVAQVAGLQRLRISSMEPGDVDQPLLDAMVANQPVVAPHLHLPLQSGSDAILQRMNRQYAVGEYLDMVDMVHDRLTLDDEPGREPLPPAITTDVICGFPGETEDDYRQTVDVARRIGYLHMHVFPYSERAGTAAARWASQSVPVAVRRERVRRLIELETDPDTGFAASFHRRLAGRIVRVVLEKRDRGEPSLSTGRCDHYALVHVPVPLQRGRMMQVRIGLQKDGRLIGRPTHTGVRLPVLSSP